MLCYFLLAGAFFIVFYVVFRKTLQSRKIQQYFPKNREYWREIRYSLLTSLIFILIPLLVVRLPVFYDHSAYQLFGAHFHSAWYAPVFFLLMLFLHDTYFYWTHRLMHHRWLFRWFHRVHHHSVSPSPWAAFSFGPLEAIVQVSIVPIFAFIIPVPAVYIDGFFIFSVLYNVYGHLGFELYPRRFNHHWLGQWINTAVHHDLHHTHSRSSYGLYLTFWDRLMGTMHKEYDACFNTVTTRKHLYSANAKNPAVIAS